MSGPDHAADLLLGDSKLMVEVRIIYKHLK